MEPIKIYEILSFVLASGIIIYFSLASFYGIRYFLITRLKKKYDWIFMMCTVISILWVLMFLYINFESVLGRPPVVYESFGALFIRPLILLTGVGTAILLRIKYIEEKCGGIAPCQRQPKI